MDVSSGGVGEWYMYDVVELCMDMCAALLLC